ncbi:peptidoglycan-binding protein [Micromonospora pattaloongensis]|uniref:peptidoglycan-binding protein n=1 Tax=Micromonospora pattaloongensis TaxID=405436 RepID=UPI000B82BADA|nr:peptidoglycan-binding domain-containing protein [Micromonospora pattaloongensis]
MARRRLGVAVFAALAVTVAALVASARLRSPAELAAETAPPPASARTAPVEKRVLTDTVVTRGRVGAEQTVDVVPRTAGGQPPVITGVTVKPGDRVDAGRVLMEISGRPVFALPGGVAAYRDLRPGAVGRDVAQLQTALTTLGFGTDDRAGSYGAGTKRAVAAFYRAKGYAPRPASDEDEVLLTRARGAVTAAERALRDARIARESASSPGGARVAAAQRAADDAAADLELARREQEQVVRRTGPMVPAAELVFLRGFPGRVDAVTAVVGAEASRPVLTVSAGRLVVRADLTPQQHGLVRKGQTARVSAESGASAEATVRDVAEGTRPSVDGRDPAGAESAAGAYEMVAVPRRALDAALAGREVGLTVIAASTREPVLAVPIAAVAAEPDGRTSVTVVADGERRRVDVVPGLVGDGYVQVTPVAGAELGPPDQVVVGT